MLPPRAGATHEPITVGVIALDDGTTQLLLVTFDMIGVGPAAAAGLYELLEREVGFGFPNVLLSCSHTHFAPGLQRADCKDLPVSPWHCLSVYLPLPPTHVHHAPHTCGLMTAWPGRGRLETSRTRGLWPTLRPSSLR